MYAAYSSPSSSEKREAIFEIEVSVATISRYGRCSRCSRCSRRLGYHCDSNLRKSPLGRSQRIYHLLRLRLHWNVQWFEPVYESGMTEEGALHCPNQCVWSSNIPLVCVATFQINLLQILAHFVGGILVSTFVHDAWAFSYLW